MKILIKMVAFVAIFLLVLLWRFPYDALVEKTVRRAEASTGSTIIYQPVSAGPLGVKVSDLQINMPSGASIRFDSARIFPTREGLRATAYQKENEMKVTVSPSLLTMTLTDIQVETGSEGIGQARATGNLTYGLATREGKGELRLVIPELKLPLPIPDPSMEIGSVYTIRNVGTPQQPRTGVSAEIKLLNKDIAANGTVSLEGQPPPSRPLINGNLSFDAPTGQGTLQLGGTWDKPSIKMNPK
jgi:hypothetical protein